MGVTGSQRSPAFSWRSENLVKDKVVLMSKKEDWISRATRTENDHVGEYPIQLAPGVNEVKVIVHNGDNSALSAEASKKIQCIVSQ